MTVSHQDLKKCSHGVTEDHMRRDKENNRIWTCSNCGNKSVWTKSHTQLSAIECRNCERLIIEWVSCSEKCRKALSKDEDIDLYD